MTMNLDRETMNSDEYFVTALQIFDYCGANSSGTLRVDSLMDKFAPFVKTNKAEFSYLKSILDPDHDNPEISVDKLARALHKYSESQKATKVDLEESFNLKSGQAPQDSDSGISADGFQLLEELQSELREKSHLAHQLRSQLDFTDRQHEEVIAALTAERDSLKVHLNMVRSENMSLSGVRREHEEACERLCGAELALHEARRELDALRRRANHADEQLTAQQAEKASLQELLTKSKEECHRINEMYASRQSALLEHNESLRADRADLAARLHDQEHFMQQIIKEKVLLEMELKDVLNKSNQTQLRMDRSIDISYTEDQMLTALDSLNADSRFTQENRLLDEESFAIALKDDQGRSTNMSIFDEIRLSFSNMSRQNVSIWNNSGQTDNLPYPDTALVTTGTQTIDENIAKGTQTDEFELYVNNNNTHYSMKCLECDKVNNYTTKLESDVKAHHITVSEMQSELDRYDDNLNILQKLVEEGNERNRVMRSVADELEAKIAKLEIACAEQRSIIDNVTMVNFDLCSVQCQIECDQATVSTQVDVPCIECEKRNIVAPHHRIRRFFWEPLKCLFQVFAVMCFLFALSVLYGVSQRQRQVRCVREPLPWRWFDAQDIMDLLLRIDYVADVPM